MSTYGEILRAKQDRASLADEMAEIVMSGSLTKERRDHYDKLSGQVEDLDRKIHALKLQDEDRQRTSDKPWLQSVLGQDVTGVHEEQTRALAPDESYKGFLEQRGIIQRDSAAGRSGIGDIVRNLAIGPKTAEEKRDLSEGVLAGGGYTVPVGLMAEVVDLMRAKATVMRSGAKTVPLSTAQTTLARLATDPVAAWKTENAAVTPTDQTFDALIFKPKVLIAVLKASRELLEDSPNLNSVISGTLSKVFALELDRVALFGSGTGDEPGGISINSEISTVDMGTNGAALTSYDPLLDALNDLQNANADPPTAAIMAPRTSRALAGLKDTLNQQLRRPAELQNLPFYPTTQVPIDQTHGTAVNASSIVIGDFTDLLVGVRSELRIELLRERYAENYEFGFLCALRADIQLARGGEFCVIEGIIP